MPGTVSGPSTDWEDFAGTFRTKPLRLAAWNWPDVTFYREQRLVLESLVENEETYVPAANKMGKDYVAGFAKLWFFLTRHPCRIVTTSAGDDHLRVLWGEGERYINTSRVPLRFKDGGPLICNHHDLRKVVNGQRCGISYCLGMVANDQNIAKMQGHHANPTDLDEANDGVPRTLFIADECSSVKDSYFRMASTWFQRALLIGNTWPCENFWRRNVEAGDVPRDSGRGYHRRIIRITAEDSPNVRAARIQESQGRRPDGRLVVPGVKSWTQYLANLKLYDEHQKAVSLRAEFYDGEEIKLFPRRWLDLAAYYAETLRTKQERKAKGIGIDPGEGSANTAMVAVDEFGVIELLSKPTPDTNVIHQEALAFIRKHGARPEQVCFDRGGGGKQIADRLRAGGFMVRTVGFGEAIALDPKRGIHKLATRLDTKEERYTFLNRRAQMYGELSERLEPQRIGEGETLREFGTFGIPKEYTSLYRQLKVLPKWYDDEGRLYLPPKQAKPDDKNAENKVTIAKLLGGGSPDEADALVLAYHAMTNKPLISRAGAI